VNNPELGVQSIHLKIGLPLRRFSTFLKDLVWMSCWK